MTAEEKNEKALKWGPALNARFAEVGFDPHNIPQDAQALIANKILEGEVLVVTRRGGHRGVHVFPPERPVVEAFTKCFDLLDKNLPPTP